MFGKSADMHSVAKAIGKSISSISIWNIMNQLGEYYFSCGLVVNSSKERQRFSNQMNRNWFDLIIARRYWNCSTIKNIKCLNSVAHE